MWLSEEWTMRTFGLPMLISSLLLVTVASAASGLNPRIVSDPKIYTEPREWDTVCPPGFGSTRELVERYFTGKTGGIIASPERVSLAFGVPGLNQEDLVLLSDGKSIESCSWLNEIYKEQWEQKILLHPDVEPMYLYDVSYYTAHGLYFVVRAGGSFVLPPPPGEERQLMYIHQGPGEGWNIMIHDASGKLAPHHQIEDVAELLATDKAGEIVR